MKTETYCDKISLLFCDNKTSSACNILEVTSFDGCWLLLGIGTLRDNKIGASDRWDIARAHPDRLPGLQKPEY